MDNDQPDNGNSPQGGAHLYVICSDALMVKIGRSNAPRERLASLQGNTGHKLTLVKILRNRGAEERTVHAAVKRFQMRGEWFRDVANFRRDLCSVLGVTINFRGNCPEDLPPNATEMAIREYIIELVGEAQCNGIFETATMEDRYYRGEVTMTEVNEVRMRHGLTPFDTGPERVRKPTFA